MTEQQKEYEAIGKLYVKGAGYVQTAISDDFIYHPPIFPPIYAKVVEAKELLAMDLCGMYQQNVTDLWLILNGCFFSVGTSDPYCVIDFDNYNVKTKYINTTLAPVWNEEFVLYDTPFLFQLFNVGVGSAYV